MAKKTKKYSLFLDALRLNILVGLVGYCALFFFDNIISSAFPFFDSFEDFDYTDLYYSDYETQDVPTDTNIIIVNFGNLDRVGIAEIVNTLQKYEPKVIGISAVFRDRQGPEDTILQQALIQKDNIVLGVMTSYNDSSEVILEKSNSFFGVHEMGHMELLAEIKDKYTDVTREFEKYFEYNDTIVYHLTLEIMKKYNITAFNNIMSRYGTCEIINYRPGSIPFKTFDYEEVKDDNPDLNVIKNKIVLLGYLRSNMDAVFDLTDSHKTPLNKRETMNLTKGVEINAHILSMMLNNSYIANLPLWLNYLITIIVMQLFFMYCIYLYIHKSKYFDFISRASQFIVIALIFWLNYLIFKEMQIKLDMFFSFVALTFSLEVLYLYEESLALLKINTYITQNIVFEKKGKIGNDNTIDLKSEKF